MPWEIRKEVVILRRGFDWEGIWSLEERKRGREGAVLYNFYVVSILFISFDWNIRLLNKSQIELIIVQFMAGAYLWSDYLHFLKKLRCGQGDCTGRPVALFETKSRSHWQRIDPLFFTVKFGIEIYEIKL